MALRTPLSVTPHLYMGDSTGRPLDMGTVYFGEQDKDPEYYPITLYSDDALTLPLAQPVHTKGGYLYDKGDMVEPHAKEIIYSVKVLDSYGRKVFYKGAMMRNSWNDDVIEQINAAIVASTDIARQIATDITNDAINNTAIEGGVLADTFVVVDGTLSQRTINKGLESIANLSTIENPKDGLRVYVKSYHAGLGRGGSYFVYNASINRSKHDGGFIISPQRAYPIDWKNPTEKQNWFAIKDVSGKGCYVRELNGSFDNYMFGSIDESESSIELNSFFNFVTNNSVLINGLNGYARGSFQTAETVKFVAEKIKGFDFNLTLTAINPIKLIFAISCESCVFSGSITVNCIRSNETNLGIAEVGIAIQRGSGSYMPTLIAFNCSSWGVVIDSSKGLEPYGIKTSIPYYNNNQLLIPKIAVHHCGKRIISSDLTKGETGFYSNIESIDIENPSSVGQRTVLKVTTLPPELVDESKIQLSYVKIADKMYLVSSIDRTTNTLKVIPRMPDSDLASTRVDYIFGGGLMINGSDSNVINIGYINSYNNTIGVMDNSSYGATIGNYTAHYAAVVYGCGTTFTFIGPMSAQCNEIYTEGNYKDVVFAGVGSLRINAVNGAFALAKCVRISVQDKDGVTNEGFDKVTFGSLYKDSYYVGRGLNRSNTHIECQPKDGYIDNIYNDVINLHIRLPDLDKNRLYGSQMKRIIAVGYLSPLGVVRDPITVHNHTDGVWTVNDSSDESQTITGSATGPSTITIVWDWTKNNVKVIVQ